ncbi:MAG: DUF1501 domain-containing protein [Pirellula sp.]|nr:DUF1501 domain-containing protein [Pirellula sp.]
MFDNLMSRRLILRQSACGFGAVAANALLGSTFAVPAANGGLIGTHHAPKAKRIIFLFMFGGVSQVDSFDYKPALNKRHGELLSFNDARQLAKTGKATEQKLLASPWKFKQYGQSGHWASELFPGTAEHIDDLCLLHGMHTEGVAHGPATLFLHSGSTNMTRPSMGSWVNYALGSENENLPGFVSITPKAPGGSRNYGAAFLPPKFQGTRLVSTSAEQFSIENLTRDDLPISEVAKQVDVLTRLNRIQLERRSTYDSELEAALESYELAWKMQRMAPEILDLSTETKATLNMYGIDDPVTKDYGQKCLLARRLCESGVRFIEVNYGSDSGNWDQHSDLPKHADHAKAVDRPIAGLLTDLKQRGLLDDTIVWWGGEFGRTPYSEGKGTGRDHNPGGFTVWLAGGGIKSGFAYGKTDELGFAGIEERVHMHDLHATLLHQLGLDHKRLTYKHAGRDFRLTDVHGRVVQNIIA